MLTLPEMHGALTHFPVALIVVACAYEIGAIAMHKQEWRVVSFWLLAATVAMSLPTLITGWLTADRIFGTGSPPSDFVDHRALGFATVGLAAILLVWRAVRRDRLSGAPLAVSVGLLLLATAVVSFTGFLGGRMVFGGEVEATSRGARAAGAHGRAHIARRSARETEGAGAGERLFAALGCRSCHALNGRGGALAPDLTHEGARHPDLSWQIAHLVDPRRVSPGSVMPSFANLPASQLHALAVYLATRK